MPFEFVKLKPDGLVMVKPRVFTDERGFFLEAYRFSDFERAGIKENFVQDNHSRSARGVLRGLHYQKSPAAQGKLMRCTLGRILDVAVDIRKDSATFCEWVAVELGADNAHMLYIPPGFAHGFLVLSDIAEIIYKCTSEFAPELEVGIRWNDPRLGVKWGVTDPVLSPKDSVLPWFKDADI
ncbi:MAG: dTDP-4-dehydrorhamnose 3,5-epimerase [Elusimicrobiota bacterium]